MLSFLNASTGNLEWVNDNNTTYTPQKLGCGIGTCATSSGTALAATLADYVLVTNGIVAITFQYDVPAGATLNINSKGAKPIIYKGSAIEADTIKADDTAMFAYDGTNYVVTSLSGGGAAPVNPNETVNISLTQVGGNSADLIGAAVTITDDDTGDTLFSATWNDSIITAEIDVNTNYTVSVETITGYSNSSFQSYHADFQNERNIIFRYVAIGVYVEAIDGTLYKSSFWASSGKTANAVVVIADACKVRIALTETSLMIHSSNTDPLENYITAKDQSSSIVDYDGEGNTNKIIQFNTVYGTNTTSYAAPYCKSYTFSYPIGQKGCLPALGQLWTLVQNKTEVNTCLSACGGTVMDTSNFFWSSTFWGLAGTNRGVWIASDSLINNNGLAVIYKVRPISAYEI